MSLVLVLTTLVDVLAMRDATLRILVQTSARVDEALDATSSVDPAEVRLLRDLVLSLEHRAGPVPAAGAALGSES